MRLAAGLRSVRARDRRLLLSFGHHVRVQAVPVGVVRPAHAALATARGRRAGETEVRDQNDPGSHADTIPEGVTHEFRGL